MGSEDDRQVESAGPSVGDRLFLALAPVGTLWLYARAYVRWQSSLNGSDNFLNAQLAITSVAWFEVTLDALPWLALALLGRGRTTAVATMVFAGQACVHLLAIHFVADAFWFELNPMSTRYKKWHNPWNQVHAAVLGIVLLRTMQLVWRHRGAHESVGPVAPRLIVPAVVLMIVGAWVQWSFRYCFPFGHFEHACIDLPCCFICVDGQYLLTLGSAAWLGLATWALHRGAAAALVMAIPCDRYGVGPRLEVVAQGVRVGVGPDPGVAKQVSRASDRAPNDFSGWARRSICLLIG